MKTDEQRNHCSSKGDIYPYDGASPLTGISLADPNPTVADFSDTGKSFDSFSIGNEILFQGRRYDKESNLYYYRARHYDPVMGRFLQNDPMGYHDSMNLYQAFNMNGVNYLDPLGLATINLFIGTEMSEKNAFKRKRKYTNMRTGMSRIRSIAQPYPNWALLRKFAAKPGRRHTLNIFEYRIVDGTGSWVSLFPFNNARLGNVEAGSNISSRDIRRLFDESLNDENGWTFFAGHTSFHKGVAQGLTIDGPRMIFMTRPRPIRNQYVGFFSCRSSEYASRIAPTANHLFSFREAKDGDGMSVHRALVAIEALLRYLMTTKNFNPEDATDEANTGYQNLLNGQKEKDRIIHESPGQNQAEISSGGVSQ